jgi:hypothetical protein
VNRLKLANNPGIWERKVKRKPPRRNPRRQTEWDASEEDIPVLDQLLCPCQKGRIEPQSREPRMFESNPRRLSRRRVAVKHGELRADPDFAPSGSPRSRVELRTTRDEPPQTCARARARLRAMTDDLH